MEYEKAYVWQPADNGRPAKRRRVEPQGLQTSWRQRRQTYIAAWGAQHQSLDDCLNGINASTVSGVADFLDEAARNHEQTRIPTGIVLAGAEGTAESAILRHLSRLPAFKKKSRLLVPLSSGSGSNLKALLKVLIQTATSRQLSLDEDDEDLHPTQKKGRKLLNYDLQSLCDHVQENPVEQVVVAFEDTEAFDSGLLSELLEMLICWQDRIPFALLLNVATSVDFLQQRLSRAAIKGLDGRLFNVTSSNEELEQVFDALMESRPSLWIGAGLMEVLLERQRDYVQSISSFVGALKYANMTARYANALTIFLDESTYSEGLTREHYEALRSLGSFMRLARQLLNARESARLKACLDSDQELRTLVLQSVTEGRAKLEAMMTAIRTVRLVQQQLPNTAVTSLSSLYLLAMSGKLNGSPLLRSLILTIKKIPSDVATILLDALRSSDAISVLADTIEPIYQDLQKLVSQQKGAGQPLRSEDDLKNSTLRTTVVAQKVELSKQKSALSAQDKAYTELMARAAKALEDNFAASLIDPKSLPFHEIFIYDLKSPYRETFTPRPRHAIERALASPHDYLDCECCASEKDGEHGEATLASTQPATAVLYQLYLESGSLINASDLWQAFSAVMGDGKEEAETLALFQRGLAEMKYLGMLKTTRKRVDHVAKVMWRGL